MTPLYSQVPARVHQAAFVQQTAQDAESSDQDRSEVTQRPKVSAIETPWTHCTWYVSVGTDINTKGQIGDISLSKSFSDIGVYPDILQCLRGDRNWESKRFEKGEPPKSAAFNKIIWFNSVWISLLWQSGWS